MTTIPVDLEWLILAGFILMPAMAYLASYEAKIDATRWHRKWMRARQAELKKDEQMFIDRMFAANQRLDERQQTTLEAEQELGRKAHDLATQTHVLLRQANSRDTVPTMQEL